MQKEKDTYNESGEERKQGYFLTSKTLYFLFSRESLEGKPRGKLSILFPSCDSTQSAYRIRSAPTPTKPIYNNTVTFEGTPLYPSYYFPPKHPSHPLPFYSNWSDKYNIRYRHIDVKACLYGHINRLYFIQRTILTILFLLFLTYYERDEKELRRREE